MDSRGGATVGRAGARLALALGCVALGACGGPKLPVVSIVVDGRTVDVEIAANPADRAQGLMHRDALAADDGMLFIYPDEAPRQFWMKDTRIPLSIAYADAKGRIVHIADMAPFDTTPVPSLYPATYALEMNKGWFAANGVEVGELITSLPQAEVR